MLMENIAKSLYNEYILCIDFLDLLVLKNNSNFIEVSAFLINKNFSHYVRLYEADNALRFHQLNNNDFLEGILEASVDENMFLDFIRGEDKFFPQSIIYEKHQNYLLKIEEIKQIPFYKDLNLDLGNFDNSCSEIQDRKAQRHEEMLEYEQSNLGKETELYLFDLYRKDSFTLDEIACLISEDCLDEVIDYKYSRFLKDYAREFVGYRKSIQIDFDNGILFYDENNKVSRSQVEKYLFDRGIIIDGFNDWLAIPPIPLKLTDKPQGQIIPLQDNQLSQQLQATIDSQAKEIAELKAQLASIEQTGKDTQSDTPADGEPLALVFDSTNANYAPDLVHALNLWLDLYHRNPKDSDSHTNKANIWLKNNTAYEYVKRGDTAMNRIREIATPLKDFGQQRAKEPKK